jgi:hypothetical protein
MEGEPEQVIETPNKPPFRYRLSVKLVPMQPGRPPRLSTNRTKLGQRESDDAQRPARAIGSAGG